jgi:hypothetical protein
MKPRHLKPESRKGKRSGFIAVPQISSHLVAGEITDNGRNVTKQRTKSKI